MDIAETVERLTTCPVSVEFAPDILRQHSEVDASGVNKIRKALGRASCEECFKLTTSLFEMLVNALNSSDRACAQSNADKLKALVGDGAFSCISDDLRLMYTFTRDGHQFRVWFGLPSHIGPEHVDSCGKNLLLDIHGAPEEVKRYKDAVLAIRPLNEVELPNGVFLYLATSMRTLP